MRHRKEDGAIAVVVAIFAVIMFVLGSLVVELGSVREAHQAAQNTADAAALAAADVLYQGGSADRNRAYDTAAQYGVDNGFPLSRNNPSTYFNGCTAEQPPVPVGRTGSWSSISGRSTCVWFFRDSTIGKDTIVQVATPPQPSQGFFGGVTSPARALAQAAIEPSTTFSCVVCVLGDWDGQNGDAIVTNGGIAINGNLSTQRNGSIVADSVGVAGSGLPDNNLTPAGMSIPTFTDPLAGLPLPPVALGATATPGSGVCSPGSYTTIVDCSSFRSGVYVIVGHNKLIGQDDFDADPSGGVLFYFTCSTTTGNGNNGITTTRACGSGERGGWIEAAGQGDIEIDGMYYSGRRFAIIYDRNNTSPIQLRGEGDTTVDGDIYVKSATFDARGNGDFEVDSLIVAGSWLFSGDPAAFEDDYSGTPASIPGPPRSAGLIK